MRHRCTFNIVPKVLANATKQGKNGVRTGKKEIKLSIFTDEIVYVENPKDSVSKLLQFISELLRSYHKIKHTTLFICQKQS